MKEYRAGIDIGSTTVKLVVLDDEDRILYGEYRRHMARTQKTLADMLQEAKDKIGDVMLRAKITGSGAINLGRAMGISFMQEVVAVATALKTSYPQTDVAIELGGEDAKIIYFKGGLDERMNGVCAGGTGSFIDQMAALLQTDAAGLNEEAKQYENIYPIAARCGVFAKTDIQPLINEGASKADLAASIFQAVVNQTISGLACGKPIRGCVAFLGGPLHFLPELKKAFIRTLQLAPENVVDPQNAHLFAAMGAALDARAEAPLSIDTMIEQLSHGVTMDFEIKRLEPLFTDQAEFAVFTERHSRAVVGRADLATYVGPCFLGIDAGSTTTKLALLGQDGELLYSFYSSNQGNPIKTAMHAIAGLKDAMPSSAYIARSCSTGYGEALLKSAFCLDEGEVETVAHCAAASFFEPQVDCVLDIGGQDMKCIRLKNGVVDTVLLNEACSSGCGSFIENFATSLGYTAPEFAKEALFAENPVDLGTRCTVFMNSNVKQAQKEGATVSDISAGLAYSVIKNAIFKVIKLADASDLGRYVVVQGGTFHNQAVLRAFEKIAGIEAVCPDISGIMGAFGAALLARDHYTGQKSTTLPLEEILSLTYTSAATRCQGCSNHCMLTINRFPGGRRHITGNRCEKGLGSEGKQQDVPNLFAYKRERMFAYQTPTAEEATRGTIGIPRVLNIYENYPFWATFFGRLGFHIILSPFSDRKLYERGMESIPSESECYPAKLSHGHVQWLIDQGVKTIFHPCVYYEHKEYETTQNCYNCPIVVSYPENLKNNVEAIADGDVHYVRPFMAFRSEKVATDRLVDVCREEWGIGEKEVRRAAHAAWVEQQRAKADVRAAGAVALSWMKKNNKKGIVIAGRPYHLDPEINHGIPEMVSTFGLAVLTEDSLPIDFVPTRPIRVLDQWVYHSRLYAAAEFVRSRDDLELLQLNSFGCGLDAVTTDQVAQILEGSNKLYTVLKIDEVNNLGAARIRLRSLLAAMKMRREQGICAAPKSVEYRRTQFTKQMRREGYTLIAPQMSKIHFDILEPVFHKYGYNVVILTNTNRTAIDTGLKYVNNDACYPSILTIGQIMDTVLSGKYDTNRLAILMSQTGGCCRASNYVGFIRNALDKLGLSHIPVISVNAAGIEKNEGFQLTPAMLIDAVHTLVYGDLFMRCVYRVRPYEAVPGSTNALHAKWQAICIDSLVNPKTKYKFKDVCRGIVEDFDKLPIREDVKKPRVGIVGEILVKYMPLANNHLVELLEKEGAEAFVPDMMDFFCYYLFNRDYKHKYLGNSFKSAFFCKIALNIIRRVRGPAVEALAASRRFEAPMPIEQVAEMTKPVLSLGNQYGEGWFLAGEMIELITEGIPNIVCIQPFACLPNHVVGKGVIKQLKKLYPQSNVAAVDYDPGASEVNQLNRIKLMLATARENMKQEQ